MSAHAIFRAAMCDHLFDTTSRYDSARKVLTFLLFCPTCGTGTEKVVETLPYEPAFRRDGMRDRGTRRLPRGGNR
jgi:hypothetical protein